MGHRVNRAKDPSSDDHQRCPRVQSTIKEARISRRPASARLTRTSSRHRRDPAFWLGQYYGSSRVRLTSSLLWTRSRSWYVSAHRSLDVLLASTQPLYDLPRASMHRSQRGPRTPRDNLDFDSPASYHEAGRHSWTGTLSAIASRDALNVCSPQTSGAVGACWGQVRLSFRRARGGHASLVRVIVVDGGRSGPSYRTVLPAFGNRDRGFVASCRVPRARTGSEPQAFGCIQR